jgi:hypothetical protein
MHAPPLCSFKGQGQLIESDNELAEVIIGERLRIRELVITRNFLSIVSCG